MDELYHYLIFRTFTESDPVCSMNVTGDFVVNGDQARTGPAGYREIPGGPAGRGSVGWPAKYYDVLFILAIDGNILFQFICNSKAHIYHISPYNKIFWYRYLVEIFRNRGQKYFYQLKMAGFSRVGFEIVFYFKKILGFDFKFWPLGDIWGLTFFCHSKSPTWLLIYFRLTLFSISYSFWDIWIEKSKVWPWLLTCRGHQIFRPFERSLPI